MEKMRGKTRKKRKKRIRFPSGKKEGEKRGEKEAKAEKRKYFFPYEISFNWKIMNVFEGSKPDFSAKYP